MKIKICGMKYAENIREVAALQPDYLGFIFHPASPRYVLSAGEESFVIPELPLGILKVGVFVDAPLKEVIRLATLYELDMVQLHGDESPEYCEDLKMLDFRLIKAFGVDEGFEFWKLDEYAAYCDYFLLDTRSAQHGGSGRKFDWKILQQYKGDKPFFLAGGIELADIPTVHDLLNGLPIQGLDFNSKLELEPALKDIRKCRDIIAAIRSELS